MLKTDGGCSSAFGNSTSSLHRNVHTSSLDSSYCVINPLPDHQFPRALYSEHCKYLFYSYEYMHVCSTFNFGLDWIWLLWSPLATKLYSGAGLLEACCIPWAFLSESALCWHNCSLEECPGLQCGLFLVWKRGELVLYRILTLCECERLV